MKAQYDDDAYFETPVEQQRGAILDESIKMEQYHRQRLDRKRKIRESERNMGRAASVSREDVYRWARDLVGKELVKRRVEGVWNTVHNEKILMATVGSPVRENHAKLEPVVSRSEDLKGEALVDAYNEQEADKRMTKRLEEEPNYYQNYD